MFTNKTLRRLGFLHEHNLCARCESSPRTMVGSFCQPCSQEPLETFVKNERFDETVTLEMMKTDYRRD